MKDRLFPIVLDWFKSSVVPNHKRLVFRTVHSKADEQINLGKTNQDDIRTLLVELVKKVSQKYFDFKVLMFACLNWDLY